MNKRDFIYLRKDNIRERKLALMELLGVNRGKLYEIYELPIDDDRLLEIDRRLAQGEPLHYAIGEISFYGRKFSVGRGVLIPRLETELMIEKAILLAKESFRERVKVLDLCSGSGVLGITFSLEINSHLTMSDISDIALHYSEMNAKNLGLECYNIIKSDLFSEINESFDIIISNPPYIPTKDIEELESSVRDYEPLIALDGGDEGLDFYRRIFKDLPNYLNKGGFFMAEIGYNQGDAIKKLCEDIEVYKDYQGHDRFFLLRY